MSQEIEGSQVRELPLNGRNVLNLIALAPGVVPGGSTAGGTGLNQGTRSGNQGWGNYQIGGAIQGQGAEYVDGSPINVLGGNTVALVMTQDAVQELSVITSDASADFGRSAGGVVNMTSRSGTDAWHGSVYEYFANTDLNANNFFNNRLGAARPQDNQNQYGVVSQRANQEGQGILFLCLGGIRKEHRRELANQCADPSHAKWCLHQSDYRSLGKLQHRAKPKCGNLDHLQPLAGDLRRPAGPYPHELLPAAEHFGSIQLVPDHANHEPPEPVQRAF